MTTQYLFAVAFAFAPGARLVFADNAKHGGKHEYLRRLDNDGDCDGCMKMKDVVIDEPPNAGDVLEPGSELRFSQKIGYDDSDIEESIRGVYFPLGPDHYPLTQELCDALRESNCPSIMMPTDFGVLPYNITELVEIAGGPPLHAPKDDFWPEFEEVVTYQKHRRIASNEIAMSDAGMKWLNLPKLWQGFTVGEVAEAVHDEYPGHHQSKLIEVLAAEGMVPDDNIIPARCIRQFLHGPVLWANMNTWSIDTVAAKNFAAKYNEGRARAEEVAWSLHCSFGTFNPACAGSIRFDQVTMNGIPQGIKDSIRGMELTSMESFTAYREGAPMHPSWPAMHSAASCMSVWLPIVATVTPAQLEEMKKTDLAVAMARTVAGVHYYTDNLAGLKMGQHIVEKELADFLAITYNAERELVDAKIKLLHFDWDVEAERILGKIDVGAATA